MDDYISMSTPIATERLDAHLQGTPDQTTYRRMIGGLMYLTASRPGIAFATFVCACYQARPTIKHLKEVKRIFWYLRQSYNMGLWYPKDSGFELIAYSDADHVGCKDDCKSTSRGLQFLGENIWKRISHKRTENKAKKRQNQARNGKVSKDEAKSKPESQPSQKVNRKVKLSKSKSTPTKSSQLREDKS
ncbi:hypothetical protein Tco_0182587, partial [Tanacetum coccineum]